MYRSVAVECVWNVSIMVGIYKTSQDFLLMVVAVWIFGQLHRTLAVPKLLHFQMII